MHAGAHANFAFPFCIRQRLIVRQLCRINPRFRVENRSRAQRKPEPRSIGRAQFAGNFCLQQRRLHRLKQSLLLGFQEPTHIHGNQHVGGTFVTFDFQAFNQRIFQTLDAVDFDAGGFFKIGIERLVGLVVARRIQVQYFGLCLGNR